MITVKLDIDNKIAASCSPIEFLRKYVLREALITKVAEVDDESNPYYTIDTPYATITVKKIAQV
jgi:hypothetical protein